MESALLAFHYIVFKELTNIAKACGKRSPLQIPVVLSVTETIVFRNYSSKFSKEQHENHGFVISCMKFT